MRLIKQRKRCQHGHVLQQRAELPLERHKCVVLSIPSRHQELKANMIPLDGDWPSLDDRLYDPKWSNNFFTLGWSSISPTNYRRLDAFALRLEPYATEGNLLLLDSHPQDRPGRNHRAHVFELMYPNARLVSAGSLKALSQNESLTTGCFGPQSRNQNGVRTRYGKEIYILLECLWYKKKSS